VGSDFTPNSTPAKSVCALQQEGCTSNNRANRNSNVVLHAKSAKFRHIELMSQAQKRAVFVTKQQYWCSKQQYREREQLGYAPQ